MASQDGYNSASAILFYMDDYRCIIIHLVNEELNDYLVILYVISGGKIFADNVIPTFEAIKEYVTIMTDDCAIIFKGIQYDVELLHKSITPYI